VALSQILGKRNDRRRLRKQLKAIQLSLFEEKDENSIFGALCRAQEFFRENSDVLDDAGNRAFYDAWLKDLDKKARFGGISHHDRLMMKIQVDELDINVPLSWPFSWPKSWRRK